MTNITHTCKFCGRVGKTSKSNWIHQSRCDKNVDRYKQVPWNKGLVGDVRSQRSAQTRLKMSDSGYNKVVDPDVEAIRKQKLSENAKKQGYGGYKPGSGRGKKGWYKGFWCDSSYELAYVIYCIDHNITITRNTTKRQYEWNGKVMNYLPDFVVDDAVVEIKGYVTPQWEAKILANPDVKVLYKKDLEDVFAYVINKYGKDFIQVYEQR